MHGHSQRLFPHARREGSEIKRNGDKPLGLGGFQAMKRAKRPDTERDGLGGSLLEKEAIRNRGSGPVRRYCESES